MSDQTYRVYCGDSTLSFVYDRSYKLSYLKKVFRKKILSCDHCTEPIEVFADLILEDEDGNLFEPQLQVNLVPVRRKL